MITEDYVSFETAKLLKEKGFDWECISYYVSDEPDDVKYSFCGETNSIWESRCCSAPTLQMAIKWLREVHDLNINNELSIHGYFCSISHIVRDSLGHIVDVEDSEAWETAYYDTHEEACEAAIKYCLENLI